MVTVPRETEEGGLSGLVSQHKQMSYNQKPARNSYILQGHVIMILSCNWLKAALTDLDWLNGSGGMSGKSGAIYSCITSCVLPWPGVHN